MVTMPNEQKVTLSNELGKLNNLHNRRDQILSGENFLWNIDLEKILRRSQQGFKVVTAILKKFVY